MKPSATRKRIGPVCASVAGAGLLVAMVFGLRPGRPSAVERPARSPGPQSPMPLVKSVGRSAASATHRFAADATDSAGTEMREAGVDRAVTPEGAPDPLAPYAPLLAALNLPAERAQRLRQLLVARSESANDADELGKEQRLPAAVTAVARRAAEAAYAQELERVVGPDDATTVREMVALAPQLTELAASLAPALRAEAMPLTAGQLLQLAEIYRDTYAGLSTGRPVDRRVGFDPQTGLGDADRRMLAAAASVLSPPQWERLRQRVAGDR